MNLTNYEKLAHLRERGVKTKTVGEYSKANYDLNICFTTVCLVFLSPATARLAMNLPDNADVSQFFGD